MVGGAGGGGGGRRGGRRPQQAEAVEGVEWQAGGKRFCLFLGCGVFGGFSHLVAVQHQLKATAPYAGYFGKLL